MTFGYELEFLGANLKTIEEKYNINYYSKYQEVPYKEFHLKPEPDFTHDKIGGELISPIYKDKEKAFQELKEKLIILKNEGAYIPENSNGVGFHIHLGKNFLKNIPYRYEFLLKFLFSFQPEIFDLARGNHDYLRNNLYLNTHPLEYQEILECIKNKNMTPYLSTGKCIRLKKDTFELRYFNSSLEEMILERYLLFSIKLYEYIIKEQWDEEKINYYFDNWDKIGLNPKLERKRVLCNELKINY